MKTMLTRRLQLIIASARARESQLLMFSCSAGGGREGAIDGKEASIPVCHICAILGKGVEGVVVGCLGGRIIALEMSFGVLGV